MNPDSTKPLADRLEAMAGNIYAYNAGAVATALSDAAAALRSEGAQAGSDTKTDDVAASLPDAVRGAIEAVVSRAAAADHEWKTDVTVKARVTIAEWLADARGPEPSSAAPLSEEERTAL